MTFINKTFAETLADMSDEELIRASERLRKSRREMKIHIERLRAEQKRRQRQRRKEQDFRRIIEDED
jgi:hypothetical protein